jgi:2-polyprenyl-3-methyl-5-hydroxy-6-metoxy-1,4-benzoquinol methylase
MKEIYDRYLEHNFATREPHPLKPHWFAYNYRALLPADTATPMLDVGPGLGEWLDCLKAWGYRGGQGIDLSPQVVEVCQSRGHRVELVADTIAWLGAHERAFGLITLLDVLEHVPRDETVALLRALRLALAPGGRLIVQVPNSQNPDAMLYRYGDFTHTAGFTESSLAEVFRVAEFSGWRFAGFEFLPWRGKRATLHRALRSLYYRWVHFRRAVDANLDPDVLHPVLYAVVER